MTFVHFYTLPLIHSLTQSSSVAYEGRKLFPLSVYMSEQNRTKGGERVLNPHTDWGWRQLETIAKKALSPLLYLTRSTFCNVSPIFLFFSSYFCLYIAYRRSSSSTICCYDNALPRVSLNIHKDSEMKEKREIKFWCIWLLITICYIINNVIKKTVCDYVLCSLKQKKKNTFSWVVNWHNSH
jgi:hypothetical protein